MTEQQLLAHIARLPHGRATLRQLLRELGLRGEQRRQLEALLERMVKKGSLIELRGGQYVLPDRTQQLATGRLGMHRDGYGFVSPAVAPPGIAGDIFIPPGAAGPAMHGDTVLARITRVAADGRAEGEVLRVLGRAHPTLTGEFRVGRRQCFVVPFESRIHQWVVIPEGLEIPGRGTNLDRIGAPAPHISSVQDMDGMIVDVEILEFPAEGGDTAVGRVIEILGHPDDFGVDVEIIIRKHHLRHRFPPEVLAQAQAVPLTLTQADLAGRRDFRGLDIVTIDGETARDFDDAVWVDRLHDGRFLLHVHIADVSHYVLPGSPIDQEAFLRGTSVYFPDRAVPMLPLELSTEICSLKPGVDRLCLSALLEIDRQGDVLRQEFCRSVIRSVERMTYTDVGLILEGDSGLRERYHRLVPRFELMKELALILYRRRMKRGAIDFDLPEPLLVFDSEGIMTSIQRTPRNIAHRIIEEFMLAANESVSRHLEEHLPESLFRVHDPPDAQKVLEFEQIAARFGHSLGIPAFPARRYPVVTRTSDGRKLRRDIVRLEESLKITSRMYQKLVEKLEGKPEERILNYLMLRSLKQARYSEKNTGHFALAARSYTHFTSPIRRYPDLVVHRLLSALLEGREPAPGDLHQIAEQCSETERRAAEAERELIEWKKVKFMTNRIGEEFDALIISTMKSGFFVELEELFVEGFVPIDFLPGERFTFQENTRAIVGERSRRAFRIGGRVRVRLDRVDGVERRLYFSLAEPEPRRGAAPKGGSGRRRRG